MIYCFCCMKPSAGLLNSTWVSLGKKKYHSTLEMSIHNPYVLILLYQSPLSVGSGLIQNGEYRAHTFHKNCILKAARFTYFPFGDGGVPAGLCKHLCVYISVCICEFYCGTPFPLPATLETLFSDCFFFKFSVLEVLGGDWNPILARAFKSHLY